VFILSNSLKAATVKLRERKLIYGNAHHKAMKLRSVNQHRGKWFEQQPLNRALGR